SAIDIETDSALRVELCELATSLEKTLVVSYHNFEGTPPVEELCALVDSVLECPVAIPKLATMVHTPGDVEILKQVLSTYAPTRPICVLGMGDDLGTRTRTTFPALGSKLAYGYLDRPIAPGQLSSAELSAFLAQRPN
ncbi:MAG: type I 3-dehydroquinate dehydratase, partial [Kiritimatiellae bacterium]|nr:type I 3-dehydroquinate dehydratase [Kiritimatiellia bacterium]